MGLYSTFSKTRKYVAMVAALWAAVLITHPENKIAGFMK